MKKRLVPLVAFAAAASCLPSTGDFTKGATDAGARTTEAGSFLPPALEAGADAGADAGPVGHSCKDIKAAQPAALDGFYPSTNGELYCDMTTDGGGWTLVGRSHGAGDAGADQNQPFGWSVASGDVRATDHPYSLGVLRTDVAFTEVLIGVLADPTAMAFGANVYKLQLTNVELTAATSTTFAVDGVSTVKGACDPPQGPSMFAHAGYTSSAREFHFRDESQTNDNIGAYYGLLTAELNTHYDDCPQGGMLNQLDGELFVR